MTRLNYRNGSYKTVPQKISLLAKASPTLEFYRQVVSILFRGAGKAKRGRYDNEEWCKSSLEVLHALESVGIEVEINGADNFTKIEGPCVFAANHMSTLETFVLPVIISPSKPATFVVKESLVKYPVFGHIMRSRDPITVGRTNPREDLTAVLQRGTEKLNAGISIIVFPQTTRYLDFDPKIFNTIGIKLARKACVPIVPVALKTDAWSNGKYLKDFGRIDPSKPVHFAFGRPQRITGRGTEEHKEIIRFIEKRLAEWTT